MDIASGHLLRAGRDLPRDPARQPDLTFADTREPRMPRDAMQSAAPLSGLSPQFVKFDGWLPYSVYWEEHPKCPTKRHILYVHNTRADLRSPYQRVWRLSTLDATEVFEITRDGTKESYRFVVVHWPETDQATGQMSLAHAHLLLPPEFAGNNKRKRRMRSAAIDVIIKYARCALYVPRWKLRPKEIGGGRACRKWSCLSWLPFAAYFLGVGYLWYRELIEKPVFLALLLGLGATALALALRFAAHQER